jgi:hypothetical protein
MSCPYSTHARTELASDASGKPLVLAQTVATDGAIPNGQYHHVALSQMTLMMVWCT